MIAVGDVLLRQGRDGHRRLALAVDLRQPRAETVERGERVLDIHRRAAPDQSTDVVGVRLGRAFDQPLDHGRRGEHRHALVRAKQREDLLRLEAAGFRHHLHAEPRHMRHDVEAGAVAHRRRMQDGVARRHRIDLGHVGEARGGEHAMRQHRALRPAGGAGGVEQPGEIVAGARHGIDGVGSKQRLVVAAADDDHVLERSAARAAPARRRGRARRSRRARRSDRGCSRAQRRAAWRWPAPRRGRRARGRTAARDRPANSWRRWRRARPAPA